MPGTGIRRGYGKGQGGAKGGRKSSATAPSDLIVLVLVRVVRARKEVACRSTIIMMKTMRRNDVQIDPLTIDRKKRVGR